MGKRAVVEQLTWETIAFLRAEAAGGPVSQSLERDGTLVEHQVFATKFPHIIICRTDRFRGGDETAVESTWRLQREQHQRAQVEINRVLDGANLAFEPWRAFR